MVFLVLMAAPVASADEIFVQIEGIEGESTAIGGPAAITAVAWNWGMTHESSTLSTSRYSESRADVQTLTFTHYLDRASPKLMEYCLTGRMIPNARLLLRQSGGKGAPYLVIELKNVIVASVETSGGNAPGRPMEEVSLAFGQVKISYTQTDSYGKSMGEIEFMWDLEAQKAM